MKLNLIEIPELNLPASDSGKIKALQVENKSPALEALLTWKREAPIDYKKILKVMKLLAGRGRVTDEKHVKKTAKPKQHGDVYEMRAHRGKARLFFFYDTIDESIVICTNAFDKGKGDQNAAFERCGKFKTLYENNFQ
jgi:mRNA-degrading endonuclease RelE of RelBE toxin-antitoxin system